MEYAPRPEYGLIHPLVMAEDGGVRTEGGADVLCLSCPIDGGDRAVRRTRRA